MTTTMELKKTALSPKQELKTQSKIIQFQEGVIAGIKRTKSEWAQELYGDSSLESRIKVSGLMNRLRRQGVMIFSKKDEATNQYFIIYVNNNKPEFQNCIEEYTENNVVHHLENVFLFMEKLINLFPSSHKFIETHAQKLITMVLNKQKNLLNIPYGDEHRTTQKNSV